MSDYKTIAELRTAVAEQTIRIALRGAYQAGDVPVAEADVRRIALEIARSIEDETQRLAPEHGLVASESSTPTPAISHDVGKVLWGSLQERADGSYRVTKLGRLATADRTWGWRETPIFVHPRTPAELARVGSR